MAKKMTVEEYRQMKANDSYKPVVIKPAPKKPSAKKASKGKK